MKTTAIIVTVEIAMLGGIVVAALSLPRSTSLLTFVIVSICAVVTGNILLYRRLSRRSQGELLRSGKGGSPWRVLIPLLICWLLWWFCVYKL